jgi:hypothetical protein
MPDLPDSSKKRILVGLGTFLVLAAIGAFFYTFFMLGSDLSQLEGLTPFDAARAAELRVGQPILVTAVLSDKNPPLVHDLVVACEETQDVDTGSWQSRKQFQQSLIVTRDGIEFVVTLQQPCLGGRLTEIPNPESNLWRWVGLRNGETLTVVGRITGTGPLALRGEHAFAGSVEDYRRDLNRSRWYVLPFSGIFLLAGAGLIVNGARKPRGSPQRVP